MQCACDSLFNTYCYTNVHAAIYVTKEFKQRKLNFDDSLPPSVLLIGIDSMSRLNFIRTLPSTLNYIQSKNWIDYQAFNKVGLNTFPNLISLLTGYSLGDIVNISNPHTDFADNYRMIWNEYRRLGYVTAFAEDMSNINTFNYCKKGFFKQPTDFYFRHYMESVDSLPIEWRDGIIYCSGSESYNERVLNIAKDFASTFRRQPSFGLFWMNSFSHDHFNAPMAVDGKIRKFLEDLERKGIMKNTIIFFLSDHGIRVGDVRVTWTGWVEERLPFLYVWLPTSFKEAYGIQYTNVLENSLRLTTPFDLYMTLQEILTLSELNYDVEPSVSCPECKSLFDKIPEVRSCEEAGIQAAWCMCIPYRQFNPESSLAIAGANFVINETGKIISQSGVDRLKCDRLQLNRVIRSHMSVASDEWYTNKSYMTVLFETSSKMLLEATIQVNDGNPKFYVTGKISRLDQYRYTSQCVHTELLKTYCHCKQDVNFFWWILSLLQ